ncbi:hypothetical protein TRVA0_014S02520 [Trichomonascus vanleenenianus]|uniref:uncharacterized protein n=1 Tax=Trichomonascus vanleenenianus TaxID=2268995 RepID=UPI003ECB1388
MEQSGRLPMTNLANKTAEEFYKYDHDLSTDSRLRLSDAFRIQQWGIPTGALTGLFFGIMAPRLAAKYKYINRPVTATRLLSALFGLPGFIIGGRIGYVSMYKRNLAQFDEGSNSQKAFDLLAHYPPQIGFVYYRTTARDESFIMKDPAAIDWKKEPPFPMNLVRNTMMAQRTHNIQNRPVQRPHEDQWGNREEPDTQSEGSSSSWDKIRENQSESSSNSWDSIRKTSSSSPSPLPLQTDRPGSLTPAPPPPALSGPPTINRPRTSWDDSDQEEFDEEVERERLGYGTNDDFSESEKKWT